MSDEINRPPHGYAVSLYIDLLPIASALPGIIERTRAHIASQQEYLVRCEQQLADATSTLAWMREHQADEIAELTAQRERIREFLGPKPTLAAGRQPQEPTNP